MKVGRTGPGPAVARIGYANEGRTKQLAASLSDFILCLLSLYCPTSLSNDTTQHTEALVMPGSRGRGVGVEGECGEGWVVGGGGPQLGTSVSLFFFFLLSPAAHAPPHERRGLACAFLLEVSLLFITSATPLLTRRTSDSASPVKCKSRALLPLSR